ncbi:MAG: PIN/TRAM domain-containing protein [Chloroflexi bacterium AL-W]|nr:PIN/TRAM domain-containing protein [Chloroflexi bacterium AL-N1]NOK65758.1 PIN/TRAM domain-containing protein [Chloroflexi bacterium AL-N10]NOK74301.1 PIN/TRAM domain-containing protein [Chloroflexi bacterium AL-N5]NOK80791.1 PIN/TRAM domain-containing protein [Chloroflexi bacterium AL-W]NOK88559.1 PIN/TRAM domain-containing protein [Chloroflexi bacterium AL-N15]
MKVSLNFLVRIAGMLVLAYIGASIGQALSNSPTSPTEVRATVLLALAGAGLGLLTTHHWTLEPIQEGIQYVKRISITELTAVVFGSLLGLIFALLLAVPLGYLPAPFGQFLPIIAAIALGYFGAVLFSARRKELGGLLQSLRKMPIVIPQQATETEKQAHYLVDTSAIIDGRIANVSQTGFIEGTLLVPRFVLNELQTLADSADDARRSKGRRGLEMLNVMQKEAVMFIEVIDVDIDGAQPVDDKLIVLARQYCCPVITNDYNLGRVADLQGVKVLNLNQLADAVRPPVVPGQDLHVMIRDIGREREQGISFLDDGTMIVVEDARELIGQTVSATVTRVYQTQTGRIVFAQLHNGSEE